MCNNAQSCLFLHYFYSYNSVFCVHVIAFSVAPTWRRMSNELGSVERVYFRQTHRSVMPCAAATFAEVLVPEYNVHNVISSRRIHPLLALTFAVVCSYSIRSNLVGCSPHKASGNSPCRLRSLPANLTIFTFKQNKANSKYSQWFLFSHEFLYKMDPHSRTHAQTKAGKVAFIVLKCTRPFISFRFWKKIAALHGSTRLLFARFLYASYCTHSAQRVLCAQQHRHHINQRTLTTKQRWAGRTKERFSEQKLNINLCVFYLYYHSQQSFIVFMILPFWIYECRLIIFLL